jgi:hypothetical protein
MAIMELDKAIHDHENNRSVISISWSSPEFMEFAPAMSWTTSAMTNVNGCVQELALLNVTVYLCRSQWLK